MHTQCIYKCKHTHSLTHSHVLEAVEKSVLTCSIPDQHCAYDWGVGMGLHQDWGGPLLDYFVCALATLLLPIKQREEFLVALNVPVATGAETGSRQRWTFVEEDLEVVIPACHDLINL